MKLAVPAIPVIALLTVVAVGCSTKKGTTPTATSGALDVTPPAAQSAGMTYTPPAPYTPPPVQQVPAFTEPTPPAKTPPAQQADAKGAARKTKGAAGTTANAAGKSGAKGGTAAAGTGGKSYTVQQRDTLFKIAKDQYGDGNQWKKIAAANPGLNADTLKVGQTITIPQ